jgi:hypothetical protein
MARPPRLKFDAAVCHVTSRGNGRRGISHNDADRKAFLETLGKVVNRFNWLCRAYRLMDYVKDYEEIGKIPDARTR